MYTFHLKYKSSLELWKISIILYNASTAFNDCLQLQLVVCIERLQRFIYSYLLCATCGERGPHAQGATQNLLHDTKMAMVILLASAKNPSGLVILHKQCL